MRAKEELVMEGEIIVIEWGKIWPLLCPTITAVLATVVQLFLA
jgi:hypothetical protein